jgi:protein CpxP
MKHQSVEFHKQTNKSKTKTNMKKLALALVFGALSVGAVSAQTTSATKVKTNHKETKIKKDGAAKGQEKHGEKEAKTPEERAEKQTQNMTKKLALTDDQVSRIKELNLQRAQQMQAIKTKYAAEKKGRGEEMKVIMTNWESQVKSVLNTDQYAKLKAMQEERKAKMKEHRGNHGEKGKSAAKTQQN